MTPTRINHVPDQPQGRYEGASGGAAQEDDIIQEWRVQQEMRPGVYVQADYNFEQPTQAAGRCHGEECVRNLRLPSGRISKSARGRPPRADPIAGAGRSTLVVRGSSDCRAFTSGYRFDLTEHYRSDMNQAWVLTSLRHTTSSQGDFRSGDGTFAGRSALSELLRMHPHSTPFRPARTTPTSVWCMARKPLWSSVPRARRSL